MIEHKIVWEPKRKINVDEIKRYIIVYYDKQNCIKMKTNLADLGAVVGLSEILNTTVKKPFNYNGGDSGC